jgi:hypothetical protein
VDAAYRETGYSARANGDPTSNSSPVDFLFKLTTPVRNVAQFKVTSVEISGVDFDSNNYLLLQLNDESSIESRTTGGSEIRAVAKILKRPVLSGTNDAILLGETFGLISNTVAFRNPQDIATLRVRLVKPNGTVVGESGSPGTAKVAFTLELDEVVNTYLYESRRKHIGFNPANL